MRKNEKTALTPDEVLRVAYADIIRDIDQDDLAALLNVNSGRVAEAVIAIRWAMHNHKLIYRHIQKQKNGRKKLAVAEVAENGQGTMKFIEDGDGLRITHG
jgi:hypothetical protein